VIWDALVLYFHLLNLIFQMLAENIWINNLHFQAHTATFCAAVLDCLSIELKGSKDFSKLYAGIAILGYIASVQEPINKKAFAQLLDFLGHRYPKVIPGYSPVRDSRLGILFSPNCNPMQIRSLFFHNSEIVCLCLFYI